MADELSNYLISGTRHAKLSPEALELMGKQAASMFLENRTAPTDAVVKLASVHEDINQEQIKRICEFTNQSIYLALHEKNKVASANSSYPQFPLADPAQAIQSLSAAAKPAVVKQADIEYSRLPGKRKTASVQAAVESRSQRVDEAVRAMFRVEELAKTASPDATSATADREVLATKEQLTGLKDNLERSGERMTLMLKEAEESYYDGIKRHLLSGESFTDVLFAANSSGASSEKVASVLRPVIERLLAEKVASPKSLKSANDGLAKVAHRLANPEHPFVSSLLEIVSLQDELRKVATALSDVDEGMGKVDNFIRERLRAAAKA